MPFHAVTAHRAQLGEGPFWDVPTQALYWVNIAGKQALRLMGGRCRCGSCPSTSRRSSL
jgi:sugar lactone lactonase YvrE